MATFTRNSLEKSPCHPIISKNKNLYFCKLHPEINRPLMVYAGTNKGLYRGHSDDGSTTWSWIFYGNGMPLADIEILRCILLLQYCVLEPSDEAHIRLILLNIIVVSGNNIYHHDIRYRCDDDVIIYNCCCWYYFPSVGLASHSASFLVSE